MIKHHVEHEAHAQTVGLVNHGLTVRHGPEHGIDGAVVGDIIAIVEHGGGKEGRHPDIVHAQTFQVGQFGANAVQIANAVAIAVAKRLYINLIDRIVLKVHPKASCLADRGSERFPCKITARVRRRRFRLGLPVRRRNGISHSLRRP